VAPAPGGRKRITIRRELWRKIALLAATTLVWLLTLVDSAMNFSQEPSSDKLIS